MAPTPIPIGGAQALTMDLPIREDFTEVFSELGEVLIVHSILGLHTQDYSAGKFSLTADQCLLVKDGRVQGKVQAVISGDFFAALASKETIFSKFSYEETPACCFKAHVSQ